MVGVGLLDPAIAPMAENGHSAVTFSLLEQVAANLKQGFIVASSDQRFVELRVRIAPAVIVSKMTPCPTLDVSRRKQTAFPLESATTQRPRQAEHFDLLPGFSDIQ